MNKSSWLYQPDKENVDEEMPLSPLGHVCEYAACAAFLGLVLVVCPIMSFAWGCLTFWRIPDADEPW